MGDRQVRVGLCHEPPSGGRRLASMLSSIDDVEVVGSAGDGAQAMTMIETMRPDLVFLDIEILGMDGLTMIERFTRSQVAVKVPLFAVLAHNRKLATKAFDSGAMDFLQRPVRLSRLEKTFGRARQRLSWREAEDTLHELLGPTPGASPQRRCDGHVWVTRRGEMLRVDLDHLDRICADGPHVRLHLGDSSFLHREGIASVEGRLDSRRFARVHRSHVVRLDQVIGIGRTISGLGELLLRGGDRLPLGRKYSSLVRRRLTIQGLATEPVAIVPATATSPRGHRPGQKRGRAASPARRGKQP